MYTIVFCETAAAPPLLVGRRAGGARRGKATLSENRVVVSSLELWRDDGLAVFRTFYDGRRLEETFELRDPRTEYSDEQIRSFISG
jgi:hypothetical protein